MGDKEASRTDTPVLIVSDAMDVCKTPVGHGMVPVPYQIWTKGSLADVFCLSVNFRDESALNLDSRIPIVFGDEPGIGGGIVSQVNKNEATPIDGAPNVRSEGAFVLRHTCRWWMNRKNTTGTTQEPTPASGYVADDGTIVGANGPGEKPTPKEESWWGKALHQTGGFFVGIGKGAVGLVKGVVDLGVGVAKLSPGSQALEDLSNATGLFDYHGFSETKQGLIDTGSAVFHHPGLIWDALTKDARDSFAKGEVGEGAGKIVFDVASLFVSGGALVKAVGKLGKLGEVVNVAGKLEKVEEVAKISEGASDLSKLEKLEEEATKLEGSAEKVEEEGAKVTRREPDANPRTRLPATKGSWDGPPGDSSWHSDIPEVNAVTDNMPIPFKNGRPDFSAWSKGRIKFEPGKLNGTDADFDMVYQKIAKMKGLPNKTAAKNWLREKGLTPHHLDNNTIDLIPSDLHGNIPHIGSASDMRGGF